MRRKSNQEPASDTATIGYWRIWDVLNIIPVCETAWWNGCKAGRFPAPIKLGPNTTAWRKSDILKCAENFSPEE